MSPAEQDGRPRQERCGIPAAEQAAWLHITAHLGVEMDSRFTAIRDRYERRTPASTDHWGRRAGVVCAGACLLIAIVLMIGGHS